MLGLPQETNVQRCYFVLHLLNSCWEREVLSNDLSRQNNMQHCAERSGLRSNFGSRSTPSHLHTFLEDGKVCDEGLMRWTEMNGFGNIRLFSKW